MKARLEAFLRRLGAAGLLGIGVLLACGGFYFTALAPAEQEARGQRLALERMRARTPYQPASTGGRADELRRFYRLFPPANELTPELERLHGLARASGLDLAQGEYRLERRPSGLWAYRVTLPVRGSYPQFRNFLSAVLRDMPIVSIDGLRFERKKAADVQLEAQVRVTLHARPSGDLQ
jgi:type II secretion system (T2SS) protein M